MVGAGGSCIFCRDNLLQMENTGKTQKVFVFFQVTEDQWQGQVMMCGGVSHPFPSHFPLSRILPSSPFQLDTYTVQAFSGLYLLSQQQVMKEGQIVPLLWEGRFYIVSSCELPSCEAPPGTRATSINTLKCVHPKFLWSSLCGFAQRGKQPHNRQGNAPSIVYGIFIREKFCPALEILKAFCLLCKVLVIRTVQQGTLQVCKVSFFFFFLDPGRIQYFNR